MTDKTGFKIIGILLVIVVLGSITAGFVHKNNLYKQMQADIVSANWTAAKNKLEYLGKYKDCENLSKTVDYHYYINLGDKNFEQKEYKSALNFYKKAKENITNDKLLEDKIKNTEAIITKHQTEENNKRLEQERKQKLEQQKLEQAKIKERQRQLADIQPAINRTFYKIDFLEDASLNARIYDFYVDPYLWMQLPFDAKEGAFKLAVLYAKLKTSEKYDDSDYLFSTKIRSSHDKSILAQYTAFNGIKIK